jgi:predicted aldo/keto reductase-like oxidoreductase
MRERCGKSDKVSETENQPISEFDSTLSRRAFLGVSAATTIIAGLSPMLAVAESKGDMPYRTLGRTGEKVSLVGLGGGHIGHKDLTDDDAVRIVRTAIDNGINFMDNCWDYNDGESERRMGQALRDGYRQKVFLMTKYDGRSRKAAAKQIDESLQRLQTDHIDLIQYHENIRPEDPDRYFADGGAHEAVMAAKQAGKIRYIGFTGHKDPFVHLRMLDEAAAHNFHFDSCQMPLNVMDAHFRSFAHQVVPRLVEQGIAVLGMKPLAEGYVLEAGVATPIECLHYALNLPTSVVINGCESVDRVNQALEAARTFKPLSSEQVSALLGRTRGAALTGKYEPFKTTSQFDGTAANPQWLG